jgi:hypothetical protein
MRPAAMMTEFFHFLALVTGQYLEKPGSVHGYLRDQRGDSRSEISCFGLDTGIILRVFPYLCLKDIPSDLHFVTGFEQRLAIGLFEFFNLRFLIWRQFKPFKWVVFRYPMLRKPRPMVGRRIFGSGRPRFLCSQVNGSCAQEACDEGDEFMHKLFVQRSWKRNKVRSRSMKLTLCPSLLVVFCSGSL